MLRTISDTRSGHHIPPGWSYNPSEWPERVLLIACALAGLGIAMYLSLYQLGVLSSVWEPLFGNGSRVVLHSGIARLVPIPDALLGAFGYLVEVIAGVIGGSDRWRAMPGIVLLYGFTVGALGMISILLVIFQPVLFHAWCTLCLASAAISVNLVGPVMDEVLASLQLLKREHARGCPVWDILWGRTERQ